MALLDRIFEACTRGSINFLRLPDIDPPESWTHGAVYLLPFDTFTQTYDAEWISPTPDRPRARLAVTRADFPYADQVFRHRFGESEASFMGRLAWSGLLRT
jgi:hypothetical protein